MQQCGPLMCFEGFGAERNKLLFFLGFLSHFWPHKIYIISTDVCYTNKSWTLRLPTFSWCRSSSKSWRSDRTWQRTQQGVILLLSDTGSCLDCKHPAEWTTVALSRIRNDAERVRLWHAKQKTLERTATGKTTKEINWKLWKSLDRRTVFLLLHSLLFPLIQTLQLLHRQTFRAELNL